MSEHDVVRRTKNPATIGTLIQDFRRLGLKRGDVVIVHSAMSKMGWIAGGAVAVIDALMRVLSPEGTLVMPTHTANNSDPARWQNPPVPQSWWSIIRTQSAPYRPEITPTWKMGIIPETFRRYPNVLRSEHPIYSFAAWGKHAERIVEGHSIEVDMGEHSPLGKIYELDGKILLLGVGHENNTSLHLAEHRSDYPNKKTRREGAAVLIAGQRQWIEWDILDYDSDDFAALGKAFEASQNYQPQQVALAKARLMSQRKIVDFGTGWLSAHRSKQADSDQDSSAMNITQSSNPTPTV
ncbi:MAG: AAC(3) family N-acetyltransferase [Phototrophicales bacterium]|nr:MAG: AAC(3) family N-acetyltransferase [Phototrophicales bacterium]